MNWPYVVHEIFTMGIAVLAIWAFGIHSGLVWLLVIFVWALFTGKIL